VPRSGDGRSEQGASVLTRTASSVPFLLQQIAWAKLPAPVTEHRFHPVRRWRFDLAWPDAKLAVEVEGGVYVEGGSRHTRGPGYEADCQKYAEALVLGWRVLRVTPRQVKTGMALRWIEGALEQIATSGGVQASGAPQPMVESLTRGDAHPATSAPHSVRVPHLGRIRPVPVRPAR
jgi:very-short-patch-repair endonuclease